MSWNRRYCGQAINEHLPSARHLAEEVETMRNRSRPLRWATAPLSAILRTRSFFPLATRLAVSHPESPLRRGPRNQDKSGPSVPRTGPCRSCWPAHSLQSRARISGYPEPGSGRRRAGERGCGAAPACPSIVRHGRGPSASMLSAAFRERCIFWVLHYDHASGLVDRPQP
jgi:hypothetical protein